MADDILHRFKPEIMVDKKMDNQRPIYTGAGFFSATGNEQQLTCKTGIGVEEVFFFQKNSDSNDSKGTSYRNYEYLEPVCPLFWGFNPPKQGLFQSKQGSFGFQV